MSDLRATFVSELNYLAQGLADDPIYAWIVQETAAREIPQIQVTPVQGRLLHLLAKLTNPRRILEIGTLSGYSGVWLARALPADGRLITLEMQEKHAEMARDSFRRAGVADRVTVHVGPAMDTLSTLVVDAPFDLCFIDADKPSNRRYFEWALAHTRSGGLILVDNVLANGRVIAPDGDEYGRAIAEFNDYIFTRYNECSTIIPLFKQDEDNLDGLLIVRVP